MAEPLQNGDILEVKLYSKMAEQGAINRIYYRVGLPPVGATHTDQNAALALNTTFKPSFRALMSSDATWRGVSVQILSRDGFDAALHSSVDGGLVLSPALPPQTSGLIALRTGRRGRSYRGRMYIPWPAETDNTDLGLPSADYVTRLQNLATVLASVQVIVAGGLNLSLEPVINSPLEAEFTTILTGHARDIWASMRSRSNFSARNTLPI